MLEIGSVTGFAHKVTVRPEVQPVQQKLHHLPLAVRNALSQDLRRLENDGVIERIDSSPWVVVHSCSAKKIRPIQDMSRFT